MHARILWATCLVGLALLAPPPATAQAPGGAREHFAAGVGHFEAGRFAEALQEFREAYRIRPHPSVLVNLANCYMEMRRPVEASAHFERYLREAGRGLDDGARREVQRALGAARAALATIEISGPGGIGLFVDGDAQGQTPLRRPIEVNPGPHVVELRHANGSVQTERVRLEAGQPATIEARAGSPTGNATAAGAELGTPGASLPSGRGETDRGTIIPPATWIAGGAAVVTLAIGIAFGATAMSQQREFDDLNADIARRIAVNVSDPEIPRLQGEAQELASSRCTNALVADLMFLATAAAVGVGAYFLITAQADDDGPVAVGAIPLPGGAGATISGSF